MRYTFVLGFNVDEHELNKIRFLVKASRQDQKKSRLSENCMQHRINNKRSKIIGENTRRRLSSNQSNLKFTSRGAQAKFDTNGAHS